jgi:hypothetical protein
MKPETVNDLMAFLQQYASLTEEVALKLAALEKTLAPNDSEIYRQYQEHLTALRRAANYTPILIALEGLHTKLLQDQ